MLIKYLRSLLGLFVAKKETAFIGRQMLPSYDSIRHDSVDSFIAPSDGWCYVSLNTGIGRAGFINLQCQTNYMDQKVYDGQLQGGYKTAFLPVRKGETVTLGTNFDNPDKKIFGFIFSEGS